MNNIYLLQQCGEGHIYHWFIYGIACLYNIQHLTPVKFTFKHNLLNFHRETFELLKPDFEFIEYNNIPEDSNIITLPYIELIQEDKVNDFIYKFLRNLILIKNNFENINKPTKLIYISRNKSNLLVGTDHGIRRHVLDESIITDKLKDIGFEIIELENYSVLDKIKLFQESKVIVSPNSGALTMCLFSNPNSQIIEILPPVCGKMEQYSTICSVLNIPFVRYLNVSAIFTDTTYVYHNYNGNAEYYIKMNDVDDFINFVKAKSID
jgi:capsular polysaccharide biosynthesis protein